MQTVGIIAEYNPFHKGHAYQIEEAKKAANADFAVVAMSGNFVQRGAPAIIDKYTRTKMALEGGADLVLELPVPFATASFVITGMFALFLTAFRSEEALLLKPRMRAYKQKSDARKSSISSWLIESRQWSSARFIRARVMFFVLRFWASSLNVKACPVQSMRCMRSYSSGVISAACKRSIPFVI